MKYNIALLPKSDEVSESLTALANEIVSHYGVKPGYLLQKNEERKSFPHMSVIQFECHDSVQLKMIWDRVLEIWETEIVIENMPATIQYKQENSGPFAGTSWAELVIDKAENPAIQQFHDALCDALNSLKVTALNLVGKNYRPHVTLFNASTEALKKESLVEAVPFAYQNTMKKISWCPVLGVANQQWELTEMLFRVLDQASTASVGTEKSEEEEEIEIDDETRKKLKSFFSEMSPEEFFERLEQSIREAPKDKKEEEEVENNISPRYK